MLDIEGLVKSSHGNDQNQTFDQESITKHIATLKDEQKKLEKMELVIAVIGTMKAGKSTTINAIVGAEVLPNRNRPMTALPTLIRHKAGQIEPLLEFQNNDPINQLFKKIRTTLEQNSSSELIQKLQQEADMSELINNIMSDHFFEKNYQGPENIFWFLKTLNDLVRLCGEVEVDFPFASYSSIEKMPVIEVEFAHLRNAETNSGQLTLLDTPGPNEAGQTHLREMLTEQLQKTSAVLAVFDYTQLASDADEQVRHELMQIAQLHQDRMFALVNKFDQKGRNGDSKEATQKKVESLMQGYIKASQVFPVSSKWGYLANRARHELAINNKLPKTHAGQEDWVSDFAQEALGRRWEQKIDDLEEVREGANILWEDSGFVQPLDEVILTAYENTSFLSIESANSKLLKISNDVNNFLSIRRGGLNHSIDSLQDSIFQLKENISGLKEIEEKTKEDSKIILDNMIKSVEIIKTDSKENLKSIIEQPLNDAKEKAEKERQAIEDRAKIITPENFQRKSERIREFAKFFFELKQKENGKSPTIELKSKKDAEKLIKSLNNYIEKEIKRSNEELMHAIDKETCSFTEKLTKKKQDAEAILTLVNSNLNSKSINISLEVPSIDSIDQHIQGIKLSTQMHINEQHRENKRYIVKDSWWSKLKNWLNDDWGREEKVSKEKFFVIDQEQIRNAIAEKLDNFYKNVNTHLEDNVQKPISEKIELFFEDLSSTIENINSDLEQSIQDKNKDKFTLEKFTKSVSELEHHFQPINQDVKGVREDLHQEKQQSKAA